MRIIIRCPKCNWEPLETSMWLCTCNHVWNTFDTGGRCPKCKKQWQHTQCLECKQWSPHIDWYKNLDEWVKEELESIKEILELELPL